MPKNNSKGKKADSKTSNFKIIASILIAGLIIIAALYIVLGPNRGAGGRLIMSGYGDENEDPTPDETIIENDTTTPGVKWNPGSGGGNGRSASSQGSEDEYNIDIDKTVMWTYPTYASVEEPWDYEDEVRIPRAGYLVIFKLEVTNNGDNTEHVTVIDNLPEGITYGGFSIPPTSVPIVSKATRNITWLVENLEPGETEIIRFRARVRLNGTMINTASAFVKEDSNLRFLDEDSATVIVVNQEYDDSDNSFFFNNNKKSNTIIIR